MGVHPLLGMHLPTWVSLLRRYPVEAAYLGRLAQVSISSLACWPMDLVEDALTASARAAARPREPLFVLGHWRSGTTWLQQLLATHPDLAYVSSYHCGAAGRFLSFGPLWRAIVGVAAPRGRPMDAVRLSPGGPAEEDGGMVRISDQAFDHCFVFPRAARAIVRRAVLLDDPGDRADWSARYGDFLARVHLDVGGRRLMLKTPANTARVAALDALYPDARFVHIHRCPYEVYASTLKMWRKLVPGQALHAYTDDDLREAVLWIYPEVMRRYRQQAAALGPDRLLELSYRQLLDDPGGQARRVLEWAGVPPSAASEAALDAYLAENSGYSRDRYRFRAEDLDLVEARWGEDLERYGAGRPEAD